MTQFKASAATEAFPAGAVADPTRLEFRNPNIEHRISNDEVKASNSRPDFGCGQRPALGLMNTKLVMSGARGQPKG